MSDDINYRSFNAEEDEIYKKSIAMIRSNIDNDVKFDLACEFIKIGDKELKDMIIDDALKIEIAELHYGKRIPLRDVAKKLGVEMERLLKANHEMMEDIVLTAEEFSEGQAGNSGAITH